MLIVNNLSRLGLNPVSFEIRKGELIALTGSSGSGKSLLLRSLADLDPNEGQVRLEGVDRADISAPAWRKKVAYLPAESGWWAALVGDHFIEPDKAGMIIGSLNLPPECLDWPVERLSTGEKQRLGLARLFERRPSVLLLDEPTSALDSASVQAVETQIMQRCKEGAAIMMTTHDDDQAKRLATRVLRIEGGRLSEIQP